MLDLNQLFCRHDYGWPIRVRDGQIRQICCKCSKEIEPRVDLTPNPKFDHPRHEIVAQEGVKPVAKVHIEPISRKRTR